MKKITAIAICIIMCFSMLCTASANENVTWEITADENVKLTDSEGKEITNGSDSAAAETTPENTEKTSDEISVVIDGEKVEFDVKPIMLDDRTLVPMRKIFEALGAVVTWDDETQTAFGTNGKVVIAFQIDNNIMTKSAANAQSEVIELDVAAQLINDRTLVPIRAISESFGCDVDWIDEIQTVVIKTAE